MKRIYYILMAIVIVLFVGGCSDDNITLKPIVIDTDKILESNDTESDNVTELIASYLREERNVKGDIKNNIEIEEIVLNLTNEGQQLQLYKVVLDYAWVNGIAVLKENKVMGMLSGMSNNGLILADLDNDNSYEIVYNTTIGSGMLRNVIEVMKINNGQTYNIELYENNKGIAILPNELDHRLYIHWNYIDLNRIAKEPIGYLMLKDDKLLIEKVD